jgi:hypothetical protein
MSARPLAFAPTVSSCPHLPASAHLAAQQASIYHDGTGGALVTWGGVNESVAFGNSEKRDSNRGCLGHGEGDLYRGQLLPARVGGVLDSRQGESLSQPLTTASLWADGYGKECLQQWLQSQPCLSPRGIIKAWLTQPAPALPSCLPCPACLQCAASRRAPT